MIRFPGWTKEAIEALYNRDGIQQEMGQGLNISAKADTCTPPKKKMQPKRSNAEFKDYVGIISNALTILGIKHVREYKFLTDRRFRFDIAILPEHGREHGIAIEFEGGIYSGGAHTRGKHYASDTKKYNLATMAGWKLLRFTSEDAKELNWEFKIVEEIKNLIGEGIKENK